MSRDLSVVQIPVAPPWAASAGDGSATVDSALTVGLASGVTPSSWAQVPKATLAHGRSFMAPTIWSGAAFATACVALDTAPGGSPDAVSVSWSDVSVRGLW